MINGYAWRIGWFDVVTVGRGILVFAAAMLARSACDALNDRWRHPRPSLERAPSRSPVTETS